MKIKVLFFVLSALFFSGSTIGDEGRANIYISDGKVPLPQDEKGRTVGCNPYTIYHNNGRIKMVGCQGYFNSMGTPIGTVYEYDEDERLIRSTYYHPDELGKDYKIVREYDKDANVISQKIYNNDGQYEDNAKELKEIP